MKSSVLLSRELLLQRDALKIERVELTRGHVYVREMTGAEKDIWEQSMLKEQKAKDGKVTYETTLEDFRAKLAVVTICDEDGNLILRPSDVKDLNKMISASNIERVVEAAQKLNAITDKDREEILKNLETSPEEDSSSGSVES
jgi:hypothetical protein